MLLAIRFAVTERAVNLIRPADVPRSYKTSDAIARYREQALHNRAEDALETAPCLQPVDALIDTDMDGKNLQRPTGAIAQWLMAVLSEPVIKGVPVWTFTPKLVGRVTALCCLRMGVRQVPDWLFLADRFRDPFRLLFGTGRLDRAACLLSLGVQPEEDNSLEEQLRVLGQLVARIDTTGDSTGRFEYGEDRRPWGPD